MWVRQHCLRGRDAFGDLVLVHRNCGSGGFHDESEVGVLDALTKQRQHLVGALDVAQRPEQNGQPGNAPHQELQLVKVVR